SDVYYREESVFGNSRFLPSFGTASYRSRINNPTCGRTPCIGKRKDSGVSPLSRIGGKTGRGGGTAQHAAQPGHFIGSTVINDVR
ncbi:MAG: hypothetical protein M3P51_06180, partial [Chloroflexota bacterium]|nr:hypothetical protein [Chloroflexota bacterium]